MKRKYKIPIMGVDWKVFYRTQKWIDDNVHDDDKDSEGLTFIKEKVIILNKDECNLVTVVHELVHAYIEGCCAGHSDLDLFSFEEIICDMFAKYGKTILSQAEEIRSHFEIRYE